MKDYWEKIQARLTKITEIGDCLVCVKIEKLQSQACELCGYSPIGWVFHLCNPRTFAVIRVGSECVKNYKAAFYMLNGRNL